MAHHHDHHAHDHQHDHAHHGHAHHHHHAGPGQFGRAFALAITLNTLFVAVEFAYGVLANSTALMADAGHNLSDVLGLVLAWGADRLSQKVPNHRYTYGLRSSSILAALANALFLLFACGAIAWEAAQRFYAPPAVAGGTVMLVAGVGIVINGLSAWLFVKGSKGDLNIRGAYLHMLADAAVSLGVVIAGLVILQTGWFWLDPAISLVIVLVIIAGTWGLLKESMRLALHAVPDHLQIADVETFLLQYPGVTGVHDLHVWGMSTTETALTAHLVMADPQLNDDRLDDIAAALKQRFTIHHATLQIEQGTRQHECSLLAHAASHAKVDHLH
ncbi:cation diffusion facilitator family transporter [Leeia oryzae]|uniref:cation diffusion facilitator family transporter n=1 Tax=Leeia oryzae TaxID=356662 RepID=UPI00036121E3|nr:cation diffusion facilitator family transporter [Leeia oryzae]